jgi:GDP-mannose 6-dehydrogenase
MTRIGVFGLGYVGAVSAAALANEGHDVIGVDPNLMKVEMINEGRSPVIEAGLDEMLRDGVAAGRIRATTDAADAVGSTDVSLVCVGTPSNRNGSLDLSQVEKVCQEIGLALGDTESRHVVVIRSTMLPGSIAGVVIPTLEAASGRRANVDFGVCVNPEFLREGTSIRDFYAPPFTLIGGQDVADVEAVRQVYATLSAEVVTVPIAVAEMAKYVSNAFHALKVAFANEIGSVCDEEGLDAVAVMDVLCRDRKLNISAAYLRPGFAFGGSCLPKDLRALVHLARRGDVDVPLLESISRSNAGQIDRAIGVITASGRTRVGVLGLAFKAGTDDLRESPIVELIERLIGKGYSVRVYDRNVSLANLHGANRVYIEREIPHIATLMADTVEDVVTASDVVVIGNADPEFAAAAATADPRTRVVDLVRAAPTQDGLP